MNVHLVGTCAMMDRTVRTLSALTDASCAVDVVSGEQLMATAAQVEHNTLLINQAFFKLIFQIASSLQCNVLSISQM